jgi:hypothetical protein
MHHNRFKGTNFQGPDWVVSLTISDRKIIALNFEYIKESTLSQENKDEICSFAAAKPPWHFDLVYVTFDPLFVTSQPGLCHLWPYPFSNFSVHVAVPAVVCDYYCHSIHDGLSYISGRLQRHAHGEHAQFRIPEILGRCSRIQEEVIFSKLLNIFVITKYNIITEF